MTKMKNSKHNLIKQLKQNISIIRLLQARKLMQVLRKNIIMRATRNHIRKKMLKIMWSNRKKIKMKEKGNNKNSLMTMKRPTIKKKLKNIRLKNRLLLRNTSRRNSTIRKSMKAMKSQKKNTLDINHQESNMWMRMVLSMKLPKRDMVMKTSGTLEEAEVVEVEGIKEEDTEGKEAVIEGAEEEVEVAEDEEMVQITTLKENKEDSIEEEDKSDMKKWKQCQIKFKRLHLLSDK
jgi:hypothetical protein